MKNIYQDKKTKTWYIHTKVKVGNEWKTCTIRGYKTLSSAKLSYDNAVERWKREHFNTDSKELLETIASDYVEYVRGGKSPRTADREQTQLNTYWLPRFQYKKIQNVYNVLELENLYSDIKNDKTMNVRKKHDVVYTFIQFSNYCYIRRLISSDLFEEVKVIFQPIKYSKAVKQERRVIPQSHISRFLATIRHESERDYTLFALLVKCGLRVSELLGLCNDCFVDGKVVVKRQLLVNGTLSDKLKTNNSYRSVPINAELQGLVKKYSKPSNERFYKISHTQFKRLLYAYEDKAGIPQYVPHEYRHSCCFYLAKKCENIGDVVYCAKCMGHSVSIFQNVYCSHLDNSLENKFFVG